MLSPRREPVSRRLGVHAQAQAQTQACAGPLAAMERWPSGHGVAIRAVHAVSLPLAQDLRGCEQPGDAQCHEQEQQLQHGPQYGEPAGSARLDAGIGASFTARLEPARGSHVRRAGSRRPIAEDIDGTITRREAGRSIAPRPMRGSRDRGGKERLRPASRSLRRRRIHSDPLCGNNTHIEDRPNIRKHIVGLYPTQNAGSASS